ncbi:C-type lectin domain family 4 member G-like [Scomber japonicus]|uniref:C-type lectin domain family 4 member G-like n=1 Tax=Scomber japonicus TaxID=13676 RepID=UPI00230692DC|nr:C-type lectin domain family 4 member G-like [Scomber japonicus]
MNKAGKHVQNEFILVKSHAKKEEEILYDEVKMPQKKAEQAANDQKATNKHRHYQLLACCLGIFCVILLFSIIAVSVYYRQCKPCQKGWEYHQSSCYAINNPDTAGQKTWEEAQEDCRGKNSDLAVIVNEDEKTFISDNSWGSSGLTGYWIGLRVENWKWKWINGSDLAEKSWITQPANNGYCVISVQNQGWKSVICRNKKRWICKKAALSV